MATSLDDDERNHDMQASTEGNSQLNDFGTFYQSMEFSDCTIIAKDDTRFPCHRMVLSKWSSVLHKTLTVDMSESRSREIRIDHSAEGVGAFLKWLYCPDHRVVDNLSVHFLLDLGHTYDVKLIVKLCCNFLIAQLNSQDPSTSYRSLEVAAKYELKELTLACDLHLSEQALDPVDCFQQMAVAERYHLPHFTRACLEFAAIHHQSIVHPQIFNLSFANIQIFLSKYPSGCIMEKLNVITQWVQDVPPDQEGVRVHLLPELMSSVLNMQTAGHLLSTEVLDKIKDIDLASYGEEWEIAQPVLLDWLAASWRQKFKTLETSSDCLQDRITKVRQLIDTNQKATMSSVFWPSHQLSVFGMDNASTHNYKLLEWTNVLNS